MFQCLTKLLHNSGTSHTSLLQTVSECQALCQTPLSPKQPMWASCFNEKIQLSNPKLGKPEQTHKKTWLPAFGYDGTINQNLTEAPPPAPAPNWEAWTLPAPLQTVSHLDTKRTTWLYPPYNNESSSKCPTGMPMSLSNGGHASSLWVSRFMSSWHKTTNLSPIP